GAILPGGAVVVGDGDRGAVAVEAQRPRRGPAEGPLAVGGRVLAVMEEAPGERARGGGQGEVGVLHQRAGRRVRLRVPLRVHLHAVTPGRAPSSGRTWRRASGAIFRGSHGAPHWRRYPLLGNRRSEA